MRSRGDRLLFALIGVAAVLGLVMAFVAPVDGDDASFHLHWIPAFYAMLRSGVWMPKWLPDGFHGFGAPTFYFYPPLTYYISSFVIWVTSITSPERIFNLTGLFTTLGSGAAAYYLLRRLHASPRMAILGGLFYAFAPYRQFDLFTRSSLSQPMGFLFLPLMLAGIVEITQRGQRYWPAALLTLSWAGLLLCALPLAVAAGMTALVAFFAFRKSVTFEQVAAIISSFVLGTMLVAFHYLPLLHFQQFVQTDTYMQGIPDGNWVPALLRGTQVRFVVQDMLIYWTQVGLLVWFWLSRARSNPTSVGIAIVLSFLVLIETPYLSSPLWDYVPIFHVLRFHARFDIFAVLLLAVLAFSPVGESLWWPIVSRITVGWAAIAVLLSLTVIFNIKGHPHGTSQWMDSPEYLPRTTIPAVTAMDSLFLPHVHDVSVVANPPLNPGESIREIHRQPTNVEWAIEASVPHTLVLHQFAWPQWKSRENGNDIQARTDSIGRIVIPLGPGTHAASLSLELSSAEKIGNVISAVSIVLLIALQSFVSIRRRRA